MSLVGGCHRHPVMPNGKYSLDAAAATANPCHEENPYLHGWLIRHPEMSPINFSVAPSNSPEYATGAPGFEFSRLGNVPTGTSGIIPNPTKGRGTANRKERRRTEGLNGAFAELRDCLPNVPVDTKLSKIKTLRLATGYIAYLMDLLGKDEQNGETEGFKGELRKAGIKEEHHIKKELNEVLKISESHNDKKTKGRTGWPQHVWALELKH